MDGLVYGLYEAYEPQEAPLGPERVFRRITGGPRMEPREGWSYVAASIPGATDLERLAAIAAGASACLRQPVGFTATPKTGYLEAFTPLGPKEALACLEEATGLQPRGRVHVPKTSLSELAGLFSSETWRLYRYRRADAEASTRRGRYWARLSIAIQDVYVSDYWLTGVFYSAPPSEIYTILNTLRGMRLDELTLYNLELAIEKRIQVYGLEKQDLQAMIHELHRRIGERYYTS